MINTINNIIHLTDWRPPVRSIPFKQETQAMPCIITKEIKEIAQQINEHHMHMVCFETLQRDLPQKVDEAVVKELCDRLYRMVKEVSTYIDLYDNHKASIEKAYKAVLRRAKYGK